MNSSTRSANLKTLLSLTILAVLMYASQVIMAPLPNIEIVSLLIILITRKFGIKALLSVYIFVGCEVLTYGIHIWVINYMYIWAILCIAILFVKRVDNVFVYTIISAIFGLLFGTLCSIPYFFIGGFGMGISNIISGIPFDITHCIGNAVICLVLYRPLTIALDKAIKTKA